MNDAADSASVRVVIREAEPCDLHQMAAIYNAVVTGPTATIWRDRPLPEAEFAAQFLEGALDGGSFVAEDPSANGGESRIVGYGDLHPFRSLPGYSGTVEHTILLADGYTGNGIGQLLLDTLIARTVALGKTSMVAAIDGGNDGSIRFHERNGFRRVGELPSVGLKHGKPVDLVLLLHQPVTA